jgi:hypothetical protein
LLLVQTLHRVEKEVSFPLKTYWSLYCACSYCITFGAVTLKKDLKKIERRIE